ncbi:MAG: hypothetical protein KFF73_04580 [Cyclobacteriaceae bacterium]|nr:hypothetical protein [Cyclobacteriaceae bacterium]
MKVSYLDYSMLILEKVSFDNVLLKKEYNKALSLLTHSEQEKLRIWLRDNLVAHQSTRHSQAEPV